MCCADWRGYCNYQLLEESVFLLIFQIRYTGSRSQETVSLQGLTQVSPFVSRHVFPLINHQPPLTMASSSCQRIVFLIDALDAETAPSVQRGLRSLANLLIFSPGGLNHSVELWVCCLLRTSCQPAPGSLSTNPPMAGSRSSKFELQVPCVCSSKCVVPPLPTLHTDKGPCKGQLYAT